MKGNLSALIREFEWLVENRSVRINHMDKGSALERARKMVIDTEENLNADIEILKDRIYKVEKSYNGRYL